MLLSEFVRNMSYDPVSGIDKMVLHGHKTKRSYFSTYWTTTEFLINRVVEVQAYDDSFHVRIDTIRNKEVTSWDFFRFFYASDLIEQDYKIHRETITEWSYQGTSIDDAIDVFVKFYVTFISPPDGELLAQHYAVRDLFFMKGYKTLYDNTVIHVYPHQGELYVVTPFGKMFFGDSPYVLDSHMDFTHLVLRDAMHVVETYDDKTISKCLDSDKYRFQENDDISLYFDKVGSSLSIMRAYRDMCSVFHRKYFYEAKQKAWRDNFDVYNEGRLRIPQNGGNFVVDSRIGSVRRRRKV